MGTNHCLLMSTAQVLTTSRRHRQLLQSSAVKMDVNINSKQADKYTEIQELTTYLQNITTSSTPGDEPALCGSFCVEQSSIIDTLRTGR